MYRLGVGGEELVGVRYSTNKVRRFRPWRPDERSQLSEAEQNAIEDVREFGMFKATNFKSFIKMHYSEELRGLTSKINLFNVDPETAQCRTCF